VGDFGSVACKRHLKRVIQCGHHHSLPETNGKHPQCGNNNTPLCSPMPEQRCKRIVNKQAARILGRNWVTGRLKKGYIVGRDLSGMRRRRKEFGLPRKQRRYEIPPFPESHHDCIYSSIGIAGSFPVRASSCMTLIIASFSGNVNFLEGPSSSSAKISIAKFKSKGSTDVHTSTAKITRPKFLFG